MPVADLADALDVAVGRDQDPVRPDDRLEEHRGDRVGTLVDDHVLEALEALGDRPRLLLAPAVGVRIADDPDDARLVRPAARIAGQGHRTERRAVVAPVAGQDLRPAGVVTGELDRVLDRLGPAQGQEDLVEVARQDLGQLGPETRPWLGGEGRLDVLELGRLGGDRVDHPPVAVADVDAHQLAVEVDDPATLGGVQVDPLGVVDRDRVDRALDRPREEGVLARQPDDLLGGHRAGGGGGRHRRHLGRVGVGPALHHIVLEPGAPGSRSPGSMGTAPVRDGPGSFRRGRGDPRPPVDQGSRWRTIRSHERSAMSPRPT